MVRTVKEFWHCATARFLLESSSRHDSICGAKEQSSVDSRPFRGRVMGRKLKTTAHQAGAQYAAISN